MDERIQGVLDAMEQAKVNMIENHGNYLVQKVCTEVLEIEGFPSGPEEFHSLQEQEIVKAVFGTHAVGVHRAFHVVMKMIKEGALIPDYDKMLQLASEYLKEGRQDADEEEDGDSDED